MSLVRSYRSPQRPDSTYSTNSVRELYLSNMTNRGFLSCTKHLGQSNKERCMYTFRNRPSKGSRPNKSLTSKNSSSVSCTPHFDFRRYWESGNRIGTRRDYEKGERSRSPVPTGWFSTESRIDAQSGSCPRGGGPTLRPRGVASH